MGQWSEQRESGFSALLSDGRTVEVTRKSVDLLESAPWCPAHEFARVLDTVELSIDVVGVTHSEADDLRAFLAGKRAAPTWFDVAKAQSR